VDARIADAAFAHRRSEKDSQPGCEYTEPRGSRIIPCEALH
jgi:hypothetical protein